MLSFLQIEERIFFDEKNDREPSFTRKKSGRT